MKQIKQNEILFEVSGEKETRKALVWACPSGGFLISIFREDNRQVGPLELVGDLEEAKDCAEDMYKEICG